MPSNIIIINFWLSVCALSISLSLLAGYIAHLWRRARQDKNNRANYVTLSNEPVIDDSWSRSEAIDALRKAEAKYRSIFENSIEGIFQTSPTGTYLSANPSLARIYGYDSPEHLMSSIGDISRQLYVDSTRRRDFVAIMAQTGQVSRFEAEIFRRDGSTAWISENAKAVFNSDGTLMHYEGTVEDITERKLAEKLQRERDAADAANAAKSDFLANMSHELRTPLNGVIGMLDLLAGMEMTPKQTHYVAVARSSADVLLTVINQVLDFSKVEAGKLELEVLDFDLRATLEDTTEILVQRAEQNGLELVLDLPADVPSLLSGDPNRLRQVLINLTNNAIKFTEQGQVIVRAILDSETETTALIRFSIEDTGIGIPADRMDRLFKSFSQVDASTTRRYGGTGLGLAISKQLVDLMGGTIDVESTVGKGSTFWFTIPLQKQNGVKQEAPIVPARLANLRVLGVDDNAINREILQQQLANWKLSVDVVASGPDALRAMSRAAQVGRPYGLAILDGQMPDMDGFELARRIKAEPKLKQTRLI
ncbi:MAG: ATP-binding protein, partial [Planctomycetota bacterium]|nr:ATP-binding protein [Planctomycetota bacterium]